MAQNFTDDFNIVIAGQAGQGIESISTVLAHILKNHGYHVYVAKEVMSRVRGGMNSVTIRVSNDRRDGYCERIDLFVPLDAGGYAHCAWRFSEETIFMGVPDIAGSKRKVIPINFIALAHEVGNRIFANTIAAGAILGLMNATRETATDYLAYFFARKGKEIVAQNIQALEKGYTIGNHASFQEDISCTFTSQHSVSEYVFLSGSEAVGIGALAGGCNMISSYPMSPGTGVLTFLAQNGREAGVLVEQATDEIGAINMTLGAWYAGARGLVTTSGGGFSLMTESVSLAGITETPIVIHLAMRPGPATGLPTRTAQEDLNLALYAGHGEFMRAIFAPGSPEQAYELTAHAFNLADHYQIPTFVLTDQHMVDALYCAPIDELTPQPHDSFVVKSDATYKRYQLTADGISPRAIPGHGTGIVKVDSDEHDEEGRITEDMDGLRMAMMEKRFFKRRELLVSEALAPDVTGVKDYKILIICWGSNKATVEEAATKSKKKGLAVAHFSQVFPLHPDTEKIMKKAEKVVVVENNAQGQFADLLERETEWMIDERINKWNGRPFSVEELTEKFNAL